MIISQNFACVFPHKVVCNIYLLLLVLILSYEHQFQYIFRKICLLYDLNYSTPDHLEPSISDVCILQRNLHLTFQNYPFFNERVAVSKVRQLSYILV